MPYTTDLETYKLEQTVRLKKYYTTNKSKLTGFNNLNHFTTWFEQTSLACDYKCHYCETSLFDIRRLLNAGIINGRLVRGGSLRGPNFELDRTDPFGEYSEVNCVLSCYYCNNDKSNTFSYEIYKNTIGPNRHESLKFLIESIL
jgi:hypothetical protein